MCDCTDHKDEIPAYDAQAIESRWMKAWEDSNLFAVDTDDSKPKKYVLEMFPYPSGDLHMGHARNYTIGDAMARQARMRGYDVLHPIGFDAFGLPAENAAIKHNTQAAAWTYKNMDQALATMRRMGFSYDLDRTVKTCSPDYYRWGQWIFEKMWEKGLVYRKKNPVNWCPTCKTVLANEQVTEGKCWRCGTEPEKRDLEQWYYKITDYSQELLDDLEKLPGWPERVKQMQANWIGRSEGAEVDFTLCDTDGEPIEGDEGKITVFTTRADTLFGVSFFVLSPEYVRLHELVEGTQYEEAVTKIVEDSKHISAVERAQGTLEKHGAFTGRYVVNPVNGEKIPVWVADYVVADYGTGAVMAVPCGDQRDFEFARKYDLPIVPIILDDEDRAAVEASGETIDTFHAENVDWDCAHAAEGTLVQSGKYTGMRGGKHSEGEAAIVADLEAMGCGRRKVEFRLRDWLISRQRYWGNPIPAIHCEHCGIVPVPEDQLPVTLPENLDLGAGETLAECKEFYETTCPVCGRPAKRETDTMDTFTCSSWSKIFGCPGIALAFYATAKPEKKKELLSLLIPITLTAIFCGVTEPIEFTFLFIAPPLFIVHCVLAALLAMAINMVGCVGVFAGGLIEISSLNFIPLMANHWQQYAMTLVVGLVFTAIWFVVFRFLIVKFDFKTPGREDDAEQVKFHSKAEYRAAKNGELASGATADVDEAADPYAIMAAGVLELLGGADNIVDVTNCVTRLRVNVKDETLVADDPDFKSIGTSGIAKNGKGMQVIIGLKVPKVRDRFEALL